MRVLGLVMAMLLVMVLLLVPVVLLVQVVLLQPPVCSRLPLVSARPQDGRHQQLGCRRPGCLERQPLARLQQALCAHMLLLRLQLQPLGQALTRCHSAAPAACRPPLLLLLLLDSPGWRLAAAGGLRLCWCCLAAAVGWAPWRWQQ
jgi:hypothetical protein